MSQTYEILHSEGSDSVVIADAVTHDDIAEIFHNERHTVSQTVEQALETARLFAAAADMRWALEKILIHEDPLSASIWGQAIIGRVKAALAKVTAA